MRCYLSNEEWDAVQWSAKRPGIVEVIFDNEDLLNKIFEIVDKKGSLIWTDFKRLGVERRWNQFKKINNVKM